MNPIKRFVKYNYMRMCYYIRNKKQRSVYFNSFQGQYSDSPRAISEAIHTIDPSITLYWAANKEENFPDYVIPIPVHSFLEAKTMAQANVWVMHGGGEKVYGIYKGKSVYSVATWHGDRGFKKVGWAAADEMGDKYHLYKRMMNFDNVDLFTVASRFGMEEYAHQGLHYHGEFVFEGLPRNDKLVNVENFSEEVALIKNRLSIPMETKVLLYAPTFRDGKKKQDSPIDLNRILKLLSKENKWVCLVRAHTSSAGINYSVESERFIDVSHSGDMSDFLLIADCLITDYSSCAPDFILTKRPCILAHYDKKEYEEQSRTLIANLDKIGFLIAHDPMEMDEIVENLYSYDHVAIADKVNRFYGTHETGHASDVVAKRIIKEIYSRSVKVNQSTSKKDLTQISFDSCLNNRI